ncbi:MAG: hypothetical protein H7840_02730 [Alphaproteobacteria bacterium]
MTGGKGRTMASGEDAGEQSGEATRRVSVATKKGFETEMEATMKGTDVSTEFYQGALAFGRDNMDALVKANMIMAQGYQEILGAMIGMAKETMEDGFGPAAIDRFTTRTSRISEIYMTMVESVMEPIGERFTAIAGVVKEGVEHPKLGHKDPEHH